MKKLLTLLLFTSITFAGYSQFYISGITFNPTAPSSCDNVTATVSGTKVCGNSVITVDSVQLGAPNPVIHVSDVVGGICLPVIQTFTINATLGILPVTTDTIVVKYYQNMVLTETHNFTLSVSNSGNQIFDTLGICQGDSAFLQGSWQLNPGIYYDTISSPNCDTITSTYLFYSSQSLYLDTTDICAGDSSFIAGEWRTVAGVYVDSFNIGGLCDSVIATKLNVGQYKSANVSITTCQGSPVFLQGADRHVSGTYIDTFYTIYGCDSIITTNLNVNRRDTNSFDVTICLGELHFAGGSFQATAGTYYDYYSNAFNCDSLVITNLAVDPTHIMIQNDTICDGDMYNFNGQNLTTAGTYYDSLQTVLGCDSVYTLHLEVLSTYFNTVDTSGCLKDSLMFNGSLVINTGTYIESYVKGNGCDSAIQFNVTIYPNDTSYSDTTICEGDSVLIFGNFQGTPGVYSQLLTSSFGCDSVDQRELKTMVCENVEEIHGTDIINVYPNPVNETLNIQVKDGVMGSIQIIDMFGRVIYSTTNQGPTPISVSNWSKGMYQIIMNHQGTISKSKFFKIE